MKMKKIKKREEVEEIYIKRKKMRRVKIGKLADMLLPYSDEDENGVKIYKLLGRVFYKKNGRYYVEVPEEKEKK